MSQKISCDLSPATNILYVVMHGSICLVDVGKDDTGTDRGFIAYLLDMGDEHNYLYGDWLTESEIPQRSPGGDPTRAQLIGVLNGGYSLNSSTNAIVKIKQPPPETDPYVRAIIRLPRPDVIYDCQSGLLDPLSIQGSSLGNQPPTSLSDIRVFQYSCTDTEEIFFTFDNGEHWTCPSFSPDNTINIAVLHIYNEPPQELQDHAVHNRLEFNFCAKFLGADLILVKNTTTLLPNGRIIGLIPEELFFLSQRSRDKENAKKSGFVLRMLQQLRNSPVTDETGSGGGQVCAGVNGIVST